MENFMIVITYLAIGMALRRIPQFPKETGTTLNLFVIYVALPALVLLQIPHLTFTRELMVPAVMPWAMVALSGGAVILAARLAQWERQVTGCLLLLVPLGNTSFLGVPMVRAFFGENAVSYALFYDQLGSFPALATYGSLIIAIYGGEKPTVPGVLQKIATFPPFIAFVIAVALKSLPYPPLVTKILGSLAATLVPVVMIAVGFQLELRLNRELASPLCVGLCIKLIVAPATAFLFCRAIGLEGLATRVSIFESGMPPMISAGALAILANLSPPLTAALVGMGIVASFLTLPLLHQLLLSL